MSSLTQPRRQHAAPENRQRPARQTPPLCVAGVSEPGCDALGDRGGDTIMCLLYKVVEGQQRVHPDPEVVLSYLFSFALLPGNALQAGDRPNGP